MRRIAALALAGTLLVGLSSPASSHDHRIPKVVLHSGGETQIGNYVSESWTRPSGRFCLFEHGDGFGGYPKAIGYRPGDEVFFRLNKKQRPDEVKILSHRAVKNGYATGRGVRLKVRLKRFRIKGKAAGWDAYFVPRSTRHNYLDFHVSWRDREGCGGSQSINRGFHLRTIS
jgi:hypothetical protein